MGSLKIVKKLSDDEMDVVKRVHLMLLDRLKIGESDNTIVVSISKKAKMKEIETELLPAIGKLLIKDKPKQRDDMWKYYLIVYDLKCRNQNASYEDLATTLQLALPSENPDRTWEPRTTENYHKQALHLIHGGYKKYLYL